MPEVFVKIEMFVRNSTHADNYFSRGVKGVERRLNNPAHNTPVCNRRENHDWNFNQRVENPNEKASSLIKTGVYHGPWVTRQSQIEDTWGGHRRGKRMALAGKYVVTGRDYDRGQRGPCGKGHDISAAN